MRYLARRSALAPSTAAALRVLEADETQREQGVRPSSTTPDEAARRIQHELAKGTRVVREAGVKPEWLGRAGTAA